MAWSIDHEPWRTCICTMCMRVIRRKNGQPFVEGRERLISATEQFQRKHHKILTIIAC